MTQEEKDILIHNAYLLFSSEEILFNQLSKLWGVSEEEAKEKFYSGITEDYKSFLGEVLRDRHVYLRNYVC